jgi:hypothetical protein
MKIKTLISACFGGIGIYFLLTGIFTVILALMAFWPGTNTYAQETHFLVVAQYLSLCIPFLVGALFLTLAPKLVKIVCRFSKIGEDETCAFVDPVVAVTVACIVTGLVLAIKLIPDAVIFGYKQFMITASPHYAAEHQYEDYRKLLGQPVFGSLLAIGVILKARALASWLVSRYEKP